MYSVCVYLWCVCVSPGLQACTGLVLPSLRHREQLLQVGHGLLQRWVRRQPNPRVYQTLHHLQGHTLGVCQGHTHLGQGAVLHPGYSSLGGQKHTSYMQTQTNDGQPTRVLQGLVEGGEMGQGQGERGEQVQKSVQSERVWQRLVQ